MNKLFYSMLESYWAMSEPDVSEIVALELQMLSLDDVVSEEKALAA